MSHLVLLNVRFVNGDDGGDSRIEYPIILGDTRSIELIRALQVSTNADNLRLFIRHLIKERGPQGQEINGVSYNVLWQNFSQHAFKKLRWSDVTVSIIGVEIDGIKLQIKEEIVEYVLDQELLIQLTEKDGMYFCS